MAENKLEGSKILSIGGKKQPDYRFIENFDKSESSLKLTYYIWPSRFFIILSCLSLFLLWSASLALFRLAPQVKVKPFLIVSQDNSDNIVRAESIGISMPSRDKLTEMYIRQYVEMRNTIINDELEMRMRWQPGGIMNFLSAPVVFRDFSSYREKIWNTLIGKGVVQETEIVSVNKIGGKNSPVWKVDFKTYTMSGKDRDGVTLERLMEVRYFTASITAVFIKERMFYGRRLINPLGFTVLRYSQTAVEGL